MEWQALRNGNRSSTTLYMCFECLSHPAEGRDVHPLLVILALLASLNATTNPWIYLCFSSAMLQQVKVGQGEID